MAHEKNYHSTELKPTKMGGYGTFQGVLAISTLLSQS